MKPTIGLVVPMYNEQARLADYGKPLLDFIAAQPSGSELLLVDDGSSDATIDMVDELLAGARDVPARVLRRPHRGKGAAVSAGLTELSTDYGGFCDIDLSTPLDHFERIIDAARRAPVLAIGSRDLPASNLVQPESRLRETLGHAYNRLVQATLTPGVVDTQCGAKVAARSVWQTVLPRLHEEGFAWDAELVAIAQALGIDIVEVPVEWRHDDRTSINVGRDGLAMVLATPRIWRNTNRTRAEHQVQVRAESTDLGATARVIDLSAFADRSHWWFRSKAALVSTALRRTARGGTGWMVDAGGGAGGVTVMLGWNPDRTLVVDGDTALASAARRRHGLHAAGADVQHLPVPDGSVDVVCLLDVIEHVPDPVAALRETARVLAPQGLVVVNVPGHEWLWSARDELLGHRRRYNRETLREQLVAARLEPVFTTHTFSWLVPALWFKGRIAQSRDSALGLDQTSTFVDRTAMVLTRLERALVGRVSLPFGTSVLAVARRTDAPA